MRTTILFLVLLSISRACSCAGVATVAGDLKRAKLVIIGRVIGVEYIPDPKFEDYELREFLFDVEDVFKGKDRVTKRGKRTVVKVRTGRGGGDCGVPFELGEHYLVFASGDDNLGTSICSATKELAHVSGAEIETLNKYKQGTTEP